MIFVQETTFDQTQLPDRVYKYRNWQNADHRRLLTDGEIFFSAPLDMDEQHECNLPTDYNSVTPELINRYAMYRAPEFGIIDPARQHLFATRTLQTTPFHNPRHRALMEETFRQDLNNQLSIFCVCEHRDNHNLWATFAGYHTGFCVGINPRVMFEDTAIIGGGGKVTYYPMSDPPMRRPFCFSDLERVQDMLNVIFCLPDIYEEEDEYRFFKFNIHSRQVRINARAVEEVIIGEFMPEDERQELIRVVTTRYPHAQIYQAKYEYDMGYYVFSPIGVDSVI